MFTHSNFVFNNINHKFFGKQFANSTHHYNHRAALNISMTEILNNHKLVLTELDLNYLRVVKQIHSNKIHVIEEPTEQTINIQADAIVTKLRGVAIGVCTADCVPILLVEPKNAIIGVVHAGWSGALNDILENTLDIMTNNILGGERDQIRALIGPCIHQESYEVGDDLQQKFKAANNLNDQYFDSLTMGGKYLFDLKLYIHHKLKSALIKSVDDVDHNTFAMPAHYGSHRRSTLHNQIYQESLLSTLFIR